MADIDLTPFGFTPTETLVYGALLDLGPSSGYALAKRLSIARANAYQALNGLVAKGAAVRTDAQPQRYRAERPDAILASVIAAESRKLDVLEQQIATVGPRPGAAHVRIEGRRGIVNAALRIAAREPNEVTCLGPVDIITSLSPAWRRRAVENLPSRVWLVSEEAVDLPVPVSGVVSLGRIADFFGSEAFVLLAAEVALVAQIREPDALGYWSSEPIIIGTVRAALTALTAPEISQGP